MNVTTLEGGSLTFRCAGTRTNQMRLSVKWYLTIGSTNTSIISNKNLSGGTMATVGSEYRSPLTLSNINRVWNGATVHCSINPTPEIHQPEPFPVISVWRR